MTSEHSKPSRSEEDRREFLKSVGRFAAVTPPAITMLLSTSLTSDAIAASGSGGSGNKGPKGNNGFGNGGNDGVPGKSHKTDTNR